MKKYSIIVAGGTGSRMKGTVPKQLLYLAGKPVILHSIETFYTSDPDIEIVVVLHPDYISAWNQIVVDFGVNIPHTIVPGGETRFDSVKNGLNTIENDGFVAVHDAARPLIDAGFVSVLFSTAEKFGSAIPGIIINDTIRVVEGDSSQQLDRTFLRAIQTPQVFRVSELQKAYTQPFKPFFTDDASVMQSAGLPIHITGGLNRNIKITHPEDIMLAEALLKISDSGM